MQNCLQAPPCQPAGQLIGLLREVELLWRQEQWASTWHIRHPGLLLVHYWKQAYNFLSLLTLVFDAQEIRRSREEALDASSLLIPASQRQASNLHPPTAGTVADQSGELLLLKNGVEIAQWRRASFSPVHSDGSPQGALQSLRRRREDALGKIVLASSEWPPRPKLQWLQRL